MNKQQIFDAFNGYFSKTGIVEVDGEWRLRGKWCEMVPYIEDDVVMVDLFIRNVETISEPVPYRKLAAIRVLLPAQWDWHDLTGEAWVQVPVVAIMPQVEVLSKVCKVRKKQTYTDEQLAAMRERLKGVKK